MKRKHQQQHKKRATCEICKAAKRNPTGHSKTYCAYGGGPFDGRFNDAILASRAAEKRRRTARQTTAVSTVNGFTTGKRRNCPAACFHRHHRPGNKRFGAGFGQMQLRTAGALQPTQRQSENTGAETRSSGNYNQTNAGNGDHTKQLHPKSYPQHAHSTRSRWNWTNAIILTHIFVLEFTT
jgi:hypothetical protein